MVTLSLDFYYIRYIFFDLTNTLPQTLIEDKCQNKEMLFHGIKIHVGDASLIIINLYAQSNLLDIDALPDCLYSEPSVMVGDCNARHVRLRDPGRPEGNGTSLLHLIKGHDCVNLPTHIFSGVLDGCIGFNLKDVELTSRAVDDMMSDHLFCYQNYRFLIHHSLQNI